MGFIEKLRQRLEAEAQERQQREEGLRLAKQAEEIARKEREAREAEVHALRRGQAQTFLGESGFPNTLGEFKKLIHTGSYITESNLPQFDPDSVMQHVVWDQHKIREVQKKGYPYTFDIIEGKHIGIEVCPDGTFIFYGARSVNFNIARNVWIQDKQILEATLEKVYTRPLVEKIESQNIPTHIVVGMS